MITKVSNTVSFLKSLWIETFLNKTNKVSDISDNSVLNGIAFAQAKVAQKALKDIAIIEAQIFPDNATGEYLDRAAALFGVDPRKGPMGSSTYIRVYADPGTTYINCQFVNVNGVRFTMEESSHTIGSNGYGYIPIRSVPMGSYTNVEANSILTVSPQPIGHIACINDYCAIGGRGEESDETFRIRIKNNSNKVAAKTVEFLTQVLQEIDDRVLRVVNVGLSSRGKIKVSVVSQNGILFTTNELTNMLTQIQDKLPIIDINSYQHALGIEFVNAKWYYVGGDIGVDFRLTIKEGFDPSIVRRNIQTNLTQFLDFRSWNFESKIYWSDLFEVIKNTEGVSFLSNEAFFPNVNLVVPQNQFPRIKSFAMRNLAGEVLYDSLDLAPVFYTR